MNTMDAALLVAQLNLTVEIERSALSALRDLGLPGDRSSFNKARKMRRYNGPRYVTRVEIKGKTLQDMYDEHPGLGYYTVDDSKFHETPYPMTLSQAMVFAAEVWKEHYADEDVHYDEDRRDFHGSFSPRRVLLIDNKHNTVQRAEIASDELVWIAELPSAEAWPGIQEQVHAALTEAHLESRADNFCSSQSLSAHAESLKQLIAMAQCNHLVVH